MATVPAEAGVPERKVGVLLGAGILLLPYVFVWFLLRSGHSALSRLVGFGWFALIVLMVLGTNNQRGSVQTVGATSSAASATPAISEASPPPATKAAEGRPVDSKWSYQDTSDQMRGTNGRIASVDANDELDFEFPYNGGSTATLNLHRKAQGTNVYVGVSKGQFICTPFGADTVAVRFDNGPIKHFGCSDTADGSADAIFLRSENKFINELKHAKRVTIEATFFQAGSRQMTFDTAGLDWQ